MDSQSSIESIKEKYLDEIKFCEENGLLNLKNKLEKSYQILLNSDLKTEYDTKYERFQKKRVKEILDGKKELKDLRLIKTILKGVIIICILMIIAVFLIK